MPSAPTSISSAPSPVTGRPQPPPPCQMSSALHRNRNHVAIGSSCCFCRSKLPDTYIGMHVRRGHKWVETPPVPLDAYLLAASNFSATTGITDVLVVTEDGSVERALRARNPPHTPEGSLPLRFHFTDHPRKGYRISIPQVRRAGVPPARRTRTRAEPLCEGTCGCVAPACTQGDIASGG